MRNGSAHTHSDGTVFSQSLLVIPSPLPAGNYYLTGDVTLTDTVTISGTVNLCLNGHTITGPSGKAAFSVPNGAALNIYNAEGTGFAGLSTSGGIQVSGGGTLKLVGAGSSGDETYAPGAGSSGGLVTVGTDGTVTKPSGGGSGGEDPGPGPDDGPHKDRHPAYANATAISASNFNSVTQAGKPNGYTGALPDIQRAYRFLTPGDYYLEGNFVMPYALVAWGGTNFCLNGSNLGADNDDWIYELQHVFWVPEKTVLNVEDCLRDLHIVWLYGGRVFVKNKGTTDWSHTGIPVVDGIPAGQDVEIRYDVDGKDPVIVLPDGATITQDMPDGTIQKVTKNPGGTLTVTTMTGGTTTTTTVTLPAGGSAGVKLPVPPDKGDSSAEPGVVLEAPAGSTVKTGSGPAITLEQPGEVAPDGSVTAPAVTVPVSGGSAVITAPEGEDVQVKPDGAAEVPAGSTVQKSGGTNNPVITLEQPGEVAADGTVTAPEVTVRDPDTKKEVTVTAPENKTVTADPGAGTADVPEGGTVQTGDVAMKITQTGGSGGTGGGGPVTVGTNGQVPLPAGSEVEVSNPKKESVTIVIALPGDGSGGTIGMTEKGVAPPSGSNVTARTRESVTIVIALPYPQGGGGDPEIKFSGSGGLIVPPHTDLTKDGETKTVTEDKNILDPDTGELGGPVNPNTPSGTPETITPDTPVTKPDATVEKDGTTGEITITPTDPQKPPVVITPKDPTNPPANPPEVDEDGKVFSDDPFVSKTEDGKKITAENGGSVDPDGTVTGDTVTVEQDDGTKTTLTAPEDDAVKVGPDGSAEAPVGTEIKRDDVNIVIDRVPDNKPVPVNPKGEPDLPPESKITITTDDGSEHTVTLPKGGEVKYDPEEKVITFEETVVITNKYGENNTLDPGDKFDPATGEITRADPGNTPGGNPGGNPGSNPGSNPGGGENAESYVISASASIGGTISPDRQVTVRAGSDQTFTIQPNEGYVISSVLVDGQRAGKVTSYTFRDVRENHTIQALFVAEGTDTDGHQEGCPKDVTCPIWPYTDSIPTDWYHDGVHYCIEKDLMIGTGPVSWEPDIPFTRGMMARVLYNHAGKPAVSGDGVFDDVDRDWYWTAITWGGRNQLLLGYGNGSFGPRDPITREQLAVLLWRYSGQPLTEGDLSFTDADQVSGYAKQALLWASRLGIIQGYPDGSFRPQESASRAEAAQMIMRYFIL